MDYIVQELPALDGMAKNEKLFQTPSGEKFIVTVEMNSPESIKLTVTDINKIEILNRVVGILINNSDLKQHIERELTNSIQQAEQQVKAKLQVQNYLLDTWGMDLNTTSQEILPAALSPKIRFLSEKKKVDEDENIEP